MLMVARAFILITLILYLSHIQKVKAQKLEELITALDEKGNDWKLTLIRNPLDFPSLVAIVFVSLAMEDMKLQVQPQGKHLEEDHEQA